MNEQGATYYESLVFGAVKEIRSKGYGTADSLGIRTDEFDSREQYIGILKHPERKGISAKFKGAIDGDLHIGNMGIENLPKEVSLEVYGREYVSELSELAKQIFPMAKITIELTKETPEHEKSLP